MSETSVIARIIIIMGIMFLLVGLLNPGAGTAWDNFSAEFTNFPDFDNPFDREERKLTAFPDYPTLSGNDSGGPDPILTGCNATLVERANCINTPDGRFTTITLNSSTSGSNAQFISFNWSRPDFENISADRLVSVRVEIDCWTYDGPAFKFWFTWAWNLAGNNIQSCPVDERPVRIVIDVTCPNTCGPSSLFPWKSHPFAMAKVLIQNNTPGFESRANFTFFRIELGVLSDQSATCKAPDGAWFPWADEVACAIAQFGAVVWKGILFLINGAIFIGSILAWFAGLIFLFISLFTWFFTIPGAPAVVQTVITTIFVGFIAVLAFMFLKIIRGSGTTG